MSTDAQFKKGKIVWYQGDDGTEKQLAAITEVTSVNPAQYHVNILATNENTVCGEGDVAGSVSAL